MRFLKKGNKQEQRRNFFKTVGRAYKGYLYKYPDGYWGWCVKGSAVARSLQSTGEIYPGIAASGYESLEWGK